MRARSLQARGSDLAYLSLGANSPFDKLRANGRACPFALSRELDERSKGGFPPT
jgi:hypothetical protein